MWPDTHLLATVLAIRSKAAQQGAPSAVSSACIAMAQAARTRPCGVSAWGAQRANSA